MFNEDNTVEQMLIEAATQSGWQYVKSQDIPRSSDSVLVESWLLEALIRLNPITHQQAEQVIYKLRAAITCGGNYDELVTANDRFRTLLFNENTEPFGKDGEYIPIRFFSEDAVEDYCVVTNQWEFPRSSVNGGKRLDLVYLINGIPVCVGEAKSPVRPQITWADGAIDMLHYEKSIPEMFVPNILTFATEGKELQYAGICAPVDKWGPWFKDEGRQHGTIESVKSNVMGLVQPNRLLDIYRYYSVFTGTSLGKKIKIVCRYQQYLGGEAIVQRVLNTYREKQGPKKGLIWHFQGSGKSWLMVFAAQKLRLQNELHAPTVVIVDDRIDLEDQITGDFTRADIPRIEYSILQQLIYKEKQETLYNSRLKRIYHKSTWAQYVLSFAIIFYAVALIIVFEPSFLKVEWICNRLSNPVLNKWSDIFALSYIFIATIIFAQKTIKSLSNSKLNKLNLKNGEIELKENKEDPSVFNKHMDEIVYFFEVTNYNVVIIEDLDRFNNTDIFLKLREVNQLLNQSNSVGRKVTFIYAVKDDICLLYTSPSPRD